MKRYPILYAWLVFVAVGLVSCEEHCATCVFSDPEIGHFEDEVCGHGEDYRNTIDKYEGNGWSCTEIKEPC